MSRINLEDSRTQDLLINSGFKLGQMDVAIAATMTITDDFPPVLRITPTGAQNVLMPPSNDSTKGLVFFIHNLTAGGVLTLQTSGGAAFATAITVAVSGGWVMVQCTGSATANLGWRSVAAEIPIA